MKLLTKTCVLIVFCVIIALSEAGRSRGSSRSSSRPSHSYSRPSHSYSRPSSSPSHSYSRPASKPSYPTQSYRPTSHPSFPAVHQTSKPSYPTQSYRPSTPAHPSFPSVQHQATSRPIGWNPSGTAHNPSGSQRPTAPYPPPAHPSYPNTHNTNWKPPASAPIQHAPLQKSYAPNFNRAPTYTQPGSHAPSAPTGPPAHPIGWRVTPPNTGSSKFGPQPSSNAYTHSGYGQSKIPSYPVGTPAVVNKNTHVTSSMPHAPSYSGANYPRQQHAVTNNYITNNHHVPTTHTFIHTPSTHTIIHTPAPAYHFTTYHHYPSYYSPYYDYHPVSSFSLGLALGSLGSHHHHHGYTDYYRDRASVHNQYNTYNSYNGDSNGNNGNNGNSGNDGTGYSNNNQNTPNNNQNSSPNNNNFGNNQNYAGTGTGPNQNMPNSNSPNSNDVAERSPFEKPPPLVYSIPGGPSENNDTDSTEIVFTNPYLIVGVENLLLYGEMHDDEDIKIIIQQDSDGLEPYPWNRVNPIVQSNTNSTAPTQDQSSISTTTISPMNAAPNVNTTSGVPLAPLP